MRIPEAQIAQVTGRLDIVEVVGEYVALRPRGGRFWGLCPFHQEKTPSFTVSADRSAYYCFGCSKGGGLIQFVMEMEQLTFPEAVRLLAERAGVAIEAEQGGATDGLSRRAYVELNNRIADTFHHLLRTSPDAAAARSYLEQRGIDAAAAAAFKLGWAPAEHGWLLGFLRSKHYSDRFLAESGLFVTRAAAAGGTEPRALFWGRLMIPIVNARGEVIAFGGRTLGEDGPKYVNSAETPYFRKHEQLFGLNHALPLLRGREEAAPAVAATAGVVVVEGYTDVIALTGIGVAAVATLGTAFGAAHARLLKRYQFAAVVMFDADEAGRSAALRSLRELAKHEVAAAVVPLPGGSDPADLVAAGETDELHRRIASPITASQYTIQAACAGKDLATAEGKERAFRDLYPYVHEFDSGIAREALLQEVALHLGLDNDTVRTEYLRRARSGGSGGSGGGVGGSRPTPAAGRSANGGETAAAAGPAGAELRLLLAVAVNRDAFGAVRNQLAADELEDERARALYIALEDCYRHGETDTDSLLCRLESTALQAMVAEKLLIDEFTVNAATYIAEGVRRVKAYALVRRRDQLLERFRRAVGGAAVVEGAAGEGGPLPDVNELLADKMFLDSELKKLREGGGE